MMNKKIKAKWVAALRSGKYEQISGRLADDANGRCCLGVLRTIANGGGHHPDEKELLSPAFCNRVGINPACALDQDIGELPGDSQGYLCNLNDGIGKSFAEIADYIEQNL